VAGDDDLRLLHVLKTGRLIEAAVVGGAILCGIAGPGGLAGYRTFAREIGLLFQIVDDILDVEGETAVMGKTKGKDAVLDKTTYVSRYGLDGARRLAAESYARARTDLTGLDAIGGSLDAVTAYIFSRDS